MYPSFIKNCIFQAQTQPQHQAPMPPQDQFQAPPPPPQVRVLILYSCRPITEFFLTGVVPNMTKFLGEKKLQGSA